jgi:hypothetical protein
MLRAIGEARVGAAMSWSDFTKGDSSDAVPRSSGVARELLVCPAHWVGILPYACSGGWILISGHTTNMLCMDQSPPGRSAILGEYDC